MSKKKENDNRFKLSKKLDPYIKEYYKYEIGVPDLSQNWLELFHGTIINDLFTIMHNNSDNQLKSDYVEKLLKPFGFTSKGGGLGTNILVLTHPYYPGVVFKIALDENGIADNFNDCLLQDIVPQYARVYARHPSGLVTVQERYFVMKPEWMSLYRNDILHTLRKLSEDFLIADLTPAMVLNYGIDRKGKFVFIDGSDLYPLKQIKPKDRLRCISIVGSHKNGELKRCGGKCKYNDDFSQLICEKCGKAYIPIALRPKKEEYSMKNIFSDGYTIDDREELDRRSREAIRTGHFEPYIPEHILNNNNDEEDYDMSHYELPEGFHVQIWKKGKEKIPFAVQDGYHMVAIDDNGDPVVKPDKVDKPKKDKKEETPDYQYQKKNKKIVHEEPDTIRVPQNVQSDPVPVKNNKPSEDYKRKILKQKEEFPEDFKVFVKDLIDTIGWEMVDAIRPNDTSKDVKIKELDDRLKSLYEEYEQIVEKSQKELDKLNQMLVSKNNDYNVMVSKCAELEEKLKNVTEERDDFGRHYSNACEGMDLLRKQIKVIQNQQTNNVIQEKMQQDEHPNCIHYQVVEETEQESSDLPGIYYHVRGDIVEAYDNYGLPIYVVVDGNAMLAANTMQLRDFIYDAFDEALEDTNEPVVINEGEEAPNANDVYNDEIHQAKTEEDLKDYTTILDNEDDDMSEDEENDVLMRLTTTPNPNLEYDPRYETAREWADRI